MQVRFPDYIVRNAKGFVERVLCKCCGAVLQSLVVDDRQTMSQVVHGKVVVREVAVLCPTPEYAELRIEMWDGSSHITPLCKRCAAALKDKNTPDVYEADVKSWQSNAPKTEYVQQALEHDAARYCYTITDRGV